MARNMYGATSADFTITSGGRVIPGAVLTLWTARTGGTQITDLLDVDSVACTTVTSAADGSVVYYGPDSDLSVHWADSGQGSRIAIRPVNLTGVGANGVNTAAIQDSAVTSDKIADGSIMGTDINPSANIDPAKIAGNPIPRTLIDAKGDLLVGTGNDAVGRLAVGADNTMLVADSTQPSGVKWAAGGGAAGVFDVTSYGATGNGTTDDTAAIQAAIDAAAAAGGVVYFPPTTGDLYSGGGYKTTDTVAIPYNVSVTMESPIRYAGAKTKAAISVNPTGNNSVFSRHMKLAATSVGGSDWTNEAYIGIQIRNSYTTAYDIVGAIDFTIGVRLFGDGDSTQGGVSYNRFTLGELGGNKVGLDVYSDDGGWVNENLFLNGEFKSYSGVNLSASRYGVRLHAGDNYFHNGNVFVKPSFEIGTSLTGGAECVPIVIESGGLNSFLNIRDESIGAAAVIRTSGIARSNYVSVNFSANGIAVDDQGDNPSSVVELADDVAVRAANRTLWSYQAIHQAAVPYNSTETNVPGMTMGGSGNDTVYTSFDGVTINADYLAVANNRSLGVRIDTRECKRFVVDVGAPEGYTGRLGVRCYDSAGTILDPDSYTATPLIRGRYTGDFDSTTAWGKCYKTQSDGVTADPCYFAVCHDDVAFIEVMVTGGSAELRLSSLAIRTPDQGATSVWTPFPENPVGHPIATQAPASGTWTLGRIVHHATPAVGQPKGWVCTVAGTPGTWVSLGNL